MLLLFVEIAIFQITYPISLLLVPSIPIRIEEVSIEESFGNYIVEIEVREDGDYEYSLDGKNYQDENRFNNVETGFYTIVVRGKNGCGITEKEISVIGFPKCITPNGDDTNDRWQITGVITHFENQAIHIYDRYGKLVKQIYPNSTGWDGSMNGQPLPSSDYWFRINLENGKEFKGHFTLNR
ncbi:T9SS type B sorting domain-containing protein [Zobellia sp. OII3]|uniref:T9SS type B sorting domain-containing protein n=1 Tax=Zobellia sp. OII3 TaxID=2034520 RepID=UPI001F38DC06|nr:T9SS type B sorting domain-containing protein [Zobellia sp. OII3]